MATPALLSVEFLGLAQQRLDGLRCGRLKRVEASLEHLHELGSLGDARDVLIELGLALPEALVLRGRLRRHVLHPRELLLSGFQTGLPLPEFVRPPRQGLEGAAQFVPPAAVGTPTRRGRA